MPVRRLSAPAVYLGIAVAGSFFFAMLSTVSGVYSIRAAHLNPFQLVLIGTVLEAATFLFEIPTGVVADVYSRRLSIAIGYLLAGCGFMLWGATTNFLTILIAQAVFGFGYTFISGALEAWIADEVGERRAGRMFLRGAQAGQLGAVAGIIVSVVLADVHLALPLLVSGAGFAVLSVAIALLMPETGFTPIQRGDRNTWQRLSHTLFAGPRTVRRRAVLVTILAISAILGASSEGFDRLRDAHLLNDIGLPPLGGLDPVYWFAVIGIGGLLISFVAAEVVKRRLDTSSHTAVARTLLGLNAALILTVVVFGLSGSFGLALGAWWATSLLRRTNGPLNTAWLNQNLEPAVRATIFSMNGQADALGQIAGGPVLGLIAARVSVTAGLVVAGLLIAPALLLYARTLRGGTPANVVPGASTG